MIIDRKIILITLILITFKFSFGGSIAAGEGDNPYYHRIINGKPNRDVVVIERLQEKDLSYFYSKLAIPVLHATAENELFQQLNKMFYEGITHFSKEIEALSEFHLLDSEEFRGYIPKYNVVVSFEVPYNSGGLLSIKVHFYQYTGGAHGLSFIETVNIDLTTGRSLEFRDLIDTPKAKEELVNTIQRAINREPFNYFIQEVDESILERIQSFYLQEGKIVVYFDLYEIAPYSTGIPEFYLDLVKLTQ